MAPQFSTLWGSHMFEKSMNSKGFGAFRQPQRDPFGDQFWIPGGDFGAREDDFGAFGEHEAALGRHLGPSGHD